MHFKLQLIVINPENGKEIKEEVSILEKHNNQIEDIGLALEDSKTILKLLQEKIVQHQIDNYINRQKDCKDCEKKYRKKGSYPIVFRTLFGDIPINSPRFYTCNCNEYNDDNCKLQKQNQKQKTFSPLTKLITENTAPERLYLESKWAAMLPFGKAVELLKDALPLSEKLNATSVRNHLNRVAKKEEAELDDEQFMFIEGCQRDWNQLPRPEGTIVVGLDGGYLRSWENKKKHFEVIAGKSIPKDRTNKYFAFVDTLEEAKPKRRLYETLKSQGLQYNQPLEFLSDGATNLQELQKYLSPLSEHYLDWFHITMRITVLNQYLKGMIKVDKETAETYQKYLEKIKWYLWHGNVPKALEYLEFFGDTFFIENEYEHLDGFKKHTEEFVSYIRNNQHYITNYGERQRNEEIYTSSFAESTINELVSRRFCKKQQMQWTKKGAHSMLQIRSKVLNEELVDCFKKWYPNFKINKRHEKKVA